MTRSTVRQVAVFAAAVAVLYVGTAALPSAPDPAGSRNHDSERTTLWTERGSQ
jgi:hypothetical protein